MSTVTIAAHRGGAGVRPENTQAAFDHAVGLGCSFLELDVHVTRDGVPVVIHDATVDRTTDGSGAVAGLSAAETAELDAGYRFSEDGRSFPFRGKGIRIPTLEEVFARYPKSWISVDLKASGTHLPAAVAELIRRFEREQRTVVGSFSCRAAAAFRKLSPEAHAIACPAEVRRMVAAAAVRLAAAVPRKADYLMVPEVWGRARIITPAFFCSCLK